MRKLLLTFLLIVLSGCGGGGGSSGGSDTSLSVNRSSLTFVADHHGSVAAAQYIGVTYRGDGLLAGWPAGGVEPHWLTLAFADETDSSAQISVQPNTTNMAPGTYTATVRVVTGRENGSGLITKDVAVSYEIRDVFHVQAAAMSLEAPWSSTTPVTGNVAAGSTTVSIFGGDSQWTASADQPWVQFSAATGTGPATIEVSADPTGLPVGVHTANVTIHDADSGEDALVAVSFEITPPMVTVSQGYLGFSAVNGAEIAGELIEFSVPGYPTIPWSASSTAPWLVLSGTNWAGSGSVTVTVDASGLASGSYNADLELTAHVPGAGLTVTVPVTLTLTAPQLTVSPTSLTVPGIRGGAAGPLPVTISLNTGGQTHPWNLALTTDGGTGWLTSDLDTGAASGTAATVQVSLDAGALDEGAHNGTVTVSAQVNGDQLSVEIPVLFEVDQRRLFVPENGVALAKLNNVSQLTRSIEVQDNAASVADPLAWSASADQAWLSVTGSGTTPGQLLLSADATGLTAGLHMAVVTVTSANPNVTNVEQVRVGLYVSEDDAADLAVDYGESDRDNYLIADPVRPYAYAHTGGSGIDVVNLYTGDIEATIAGVGGALGEMAIASDGGQLYVHDRANSTVVPVDLSSRTALTAWQSAHFVDGDFDEGVFIEYARPNGRPMLITSRHVLLDIATGAVFDAEPRYGVEFEVAGDSRSLYTLSLGRYVIHYDYLYGGRASIAWDQWASGTPNGGNPSDIAVNHDGSRIYHADGGFYDFMAFQFVDDAYSYLGPRDAEAYPNNVEVAFDGRLAGGINCLAGNEPCIWIYGANGAQIRTVQGSWVEGSLLPRTLQFSGDGLRVGALTDTNKLWIVNAQ